jgi:drug/metabolite transporter (DMT)-like permease
MEHAQAPAAAAQPAAGFSLTDLTLLLVACIWSVNFIVVKLLLAVVTPLAFVGVRMILAAALMGVVYWQTGGDFRLTRRDYLHLVVLGLLGSTLYQLLFVNGLNLTTAGNAALIQAAGPVIVAAESHLLGLERLRPIAWLGVLLSFLGLYLVIQGGAQALSFGSESLKGNLLVLGAVTSWASYTTLSRPLYLRHPPDKVSAISMVLGVIPLVFISWPAVAAQPWASLPWTVWLAIAYSGALSIGFAYLLWGRAVRRVGSPRTAVYTNLVPVMVAGLAAVILGEAVTWLQVGGAVIIFAGIALTRLRQRR